MGNPRRHIEELITDLAARQHGLATRAQLLAAGLSPAIIKSRVSARSLRPVHRGVYRVGPVQSPYMKQMAAVLACGQDAVVSHRSAAALWELLPTPRKADPIDISLPRRSRRRRPAVRCRRMSPFEPEEVTRISGVPVTSPVRTLLDLAGVAGDRELEQALAQAERRELTGRPHLRSLVERRPTHRGTRRLRHLLRATRDPALTRSEAEERLLALIKKARLPAPRTNVRVGRYEVDFLWRRERLVVETDGYAFHSSKRRFEGDRRRDADLAARGFQVIRVTWDQLVKEPEATLATLAQALASR